MRSKSRQAIRSKEWWNARLPQPLPKERCTSEEWHEWVNSLGPPQANGGSKAVYWLSKEWVLKVGVFRAYWFEEFRGERVQLAERMVGADHVAFTIYHPRLCVALQERCTHNPLATKHLLKQWSKFYEVHVDSPEHQPWVLGYENLDWHDANVRWKGSTFKLIDF